jgi:pimeloyl-ACP methyl ester carboxylesterase
VRAHVGKPTLAFLATIVLAVCPLALAGAPPAAAAIPFAPCGSSNNFACGHLTVPLDPGGTSPGTITLAVRRHRAPVGEARSAVVALAGGPGQSALPFAEYFMETLGPILATRDLIVFDQRGTGLSHPLSCHALEHPGSYHALSALIESCASQLGASRGFYTTPDSVADIEAIRVAGGYEKLVLYGTSYGTKVALEYAQEHPEHVEALILDSVVPADGPEPLDLPTLAAIPRILRQLCAYRQCAGITPNPVRDLARVVARMRAGPLSGRVIGSHGQVRTVHVSPDDLLGILLAGDFDPILRAEFVPAMRAAAGGDNAPLARLFALAAGGEGEEASEGIDVPLYYATSCEEEAFPWSRAATPRARIAQALAHIRGLPPGSIAPFGASEVFAFSDMPACAFWPFTTPAPPVDDAPLPNVPTVIFSGADDLRTPTSGARAVAAQIPDAHVVVVPNTGHSVLSTEPTPCAREALRALFAAKPIAPCPTEPPSPFLRPAPLPPRRLSALAPARGYRGRTGRTVQAVKLTLAALSRGLVLALLETFSSGRDLSASAGDLSTGGLRAGWVQAAAGKLHFHGYSYIPGVTISGTAKPESATLRIGGAAAVHGTLRLGPHHALVGRLAGRRVRIAAGGSGGVSSATIARATPSSAAAGTNSALRMPRTLQLVQAQLERLPAGLGAGLAVLPTLWAARRGAEL